MCGSKLFHELSISAVYWLSHLNRDRHFAYSVRFVFG